MIITIDGPVASGKTTISRAVAERLGFKVLQTSLFYRAAAYLILEELELLSCTDSFLIDERIRVFCDALTAQKTALFDRIVYGYRADARFPFVSIDGDDKTILIQTSFFDMPASIASSFAIVRDYLLDLQRDVALKYDIVAEGRDCGTVLFLRAEYKFYLDASLDVRVSRYQSDAKRAGARPTDEIVAEIKQRDQQDISRAIAPLRRADDAILIDSSGMSTAEVIDFICKKVQSICQKQPQ